MNQKVVQTSELVRMKLDLKNQEILFEVVLVYNLRTKNLLNMTFSQNNDPEQYSISREIY